MSKTEKTAYRNAIRERYLKSGKEAKAKILDEFCAVCGIHRKSAIRILRRVAVTVRKRPGRKPLYRFGDFLTVLKRVWLATDQMCSKKLKAALPLWLPFYHSTYEPIPGALYKKLLQVSPATIDRILEPARRIKGKRFCGTRPGTLLRNQIPIRTNHWDATKPGFMEADTVAHCGNSLSGDFINTLTATDILTAWTESRAIWNKGAQGVVVSIKDIEAHLPFRLRGFDCDNGSEFLNYHVVNYFAGHRHKIQFTRSRPNMKNDNPYIEQKNWSHVRQLLGYDRLDNPLLVSALNDLYTNEYSLYCNHFCPTLKLKTKTRFNSKYRKTYEPPKTPYQRVMESPDVPITKKHRLQTAHNSLNPFKLRQTIQSKLKAIFQSVTVTANVRQRI